MYDCRCRTLSQHTTRGRFGRTKEGIDVRQDKTVSTDSLMDLPSLVLKNNHFEFDQKYYLQKQGTVIGTKMD